MQVLFLLTHMGTTNEVCSWQDQGIVATSTYNVCLSCRSLTSMYVFCPLPWKHPGGIVLIKVLMWFISSLNAMHDFIGPQKSHAILKLKRFHDKTNTTHCPKAMLVLLKAAVSSLYRKCMMTMRILLGNGNGKNIVSTEDC